MAAILQLRRGAITDFNGYGTNLSEPYFDTDRDTIHIGTSDGTGSNADWITLVKLSQANRDFTKSEPNTGSLWIVGDITSSDNPDVNLGPYDAINNPNGYDPYSGVLPSSIHSTSSMYLNGNLTASHAWFRRDVRIDGHLILGDSNNPSTYDVVNVQSDFSGSLIPDNDAYGTLTATSTTAYHDFGTNAKRWRNIYLQNNGSDEDGFISASHLDLTGRAKIDGTLEVDGQSTLASANVEDLTNNRIVIAGIDGELEDDINFTFDGDEFNIGQDNFTVQRDSGNTHTSGTLDVDGQATLASANVEDLTETRLVIVGSNGELQDSPNLTFDEPNFRLIGDYYQSGSGATFQFVGAGGEITGSWTISELAVDNGIIFTNEFGTLDNQNEFTWDGGTLYVDGNISGSGTLDIDGQSTLNSLKVEDLTEDRITIAGVGGEIEDDQYFRYTGNDFIIGSAEHFKVTTATGNTFISGAVQMFSTLNVDDQTTVASLNVEDLTDNRVVIVGAGGEIEDDGNFTFNGTELNIGTGNFTVQQGSGNTQILGTLDVDSQSTLSSVNVQDLTSGRVVLAGVSGEIEDSGNLTFDGSLLTVTGDTIITGDLTVQGDTTQLNVSTLNVEDKNILIASGAADASAANGGGITIDGADATILYSSGNDSFQLNKQLQVEGNISGSSFGGTTLLSSSNENFADYSQSVDSRLDSIEGPMSTSLDSRLIEIFATGSDHETRLDLIEGTMSSSFDLRILESFSTASDHELRLLESFSTASDHETRIDVIETTYATTGSNSFVGDQIITGSLIVSSSSTFTNMGPTVLSGSVSISGSINSVDYIDFNTSSLVDGKPGRLRWNDTDGTLDLTLKKGNVTLQVGQEIVINAYNNTTSSLLESEVRAVYVSGSVSNFPAVNLADNLTRRASENTIGIVTEDIGVGELGYVTTQGMVRNVDMSSFTAGDTLYLGAADGVLVNTPPLPPALTVIMGYCINNDAVTGSMYVNVRSGFEYPQYAIAYNLSDHTASLANTETLIDMDTPQVQSGITVVDGSKFTVSTPGLYEFVTIAQINRDASSGTASMYFWAKKNGVDVPNSNNNIDITGNTGTAATLLDRNLVIVLEAGDYIQFYWATDDTDMVLKYTAASSTPTRPATPAVKITATRIS